MARHLTTDPMSRQLYTFLRDNPLKYNLVPTIRRQNHEKEIVASMFALALAAATIAPTVAHAEKKPGIQDGSVLWKTTGNTKTDFGLSLNYEDALKPTYSVQVPQSLQMQEDGTDVYVKVSNTKNLAENNKYVSVKVRDTWATNFPKKYRDDDHKYNLYCG